MPDSVSSSRPANSERISEPAWLVTVVLLGAAAFMLRGDGTGWRVAGTLLGLGAALVAAVLAVRARRVGTASPWLAVVTVVAAVALLVAVALVWL